MILMVMQQLTARREKGQKQRGYGEGIIAIAQLSSCSC